MDGFKDFETDYKSIDEIVGILPKVYAGISEIVETYLDIDSDDKQILILWIISARYKDAFSTFPILYLNASKGSGKSRLLRLIEALIPESVFASALSESAFFRICSVKRCILIDEAEHLGSKEKANLRELLNACYKKGGKVLRSEVRGRNFAVKEFPVYNPVALANIWGLDSIVEDRCITLVLEKSTNQGIITMPELFHLDDRITTIKKYFLESGSYILQYLEPIYNKLFFELLKQHTQHTQPTLTYTNFDAQEFLRLVHECRLSGRNLELWLPLFIVSYGMGNDLFNSTLHLAKERSAKKDEEEETSDRDTNLAISLYSFLEGREEPKLATREFKDFYEAENGKQEWMSSEFLGRFFRRLKIVVSKRRLATGFEFTLSKERLKKYLMVRNVLHNIHQPEKAFTDENSVGSVGSVGKREVGEHQATINTKCEFCGKIAVCKLIDSRRVCDDCAEQSDSHV